ncbi:PAP2 superfamily C-terminal-domain-containing protein [Absidia repens]|uniref:PAP2 superfamily C-terminal-domain-containing protein n=1 Tax=Absidia repens TaxID=90262 RepID=A0A1X2IHL4_9FUNG|nr:PAP2 superfamily C-terminal-domain-containing protein [Absidia repens]
MVNLTYIFLSSDVTGHKSKESGSTTIAPWADSYQSIFGIDLRLQPPTTIHTINDCIHIFANHDFLRLVIAILFFICCGLIESFFTQLSEARYNTQYGSNYPLGDLLHDGLPYVYDYHIVNYFLTACLLYTIILFAFQSPDWSTRWIVLRRWLIISGVIYIFRGITLVVTTLPSPLVAYCQVSRITLNGSAGERFGYLFQMIGGSINPCTDQIFSGHTSAMMSCVMVWRIHSRMRIVYTWILYALALAGMLMIIATHFHYTIDVILAIFIVYTIWNIYMRYIQDATLRYTSEHTPRHLNMDVIRPSQGNTTDAIAIYDYLNWQLNPLALLGYYGYIFDYGPSALLIGMVNGNVAAILVKVMILCWMLLCVENFFMRHQ